MEAMTDESMKEIELEKIEKRGRDEGAVKAWRFEVKKAEGAQRVFYGRVGPGQSGRRYTTKKRALSMVYARRR